MGAAAGARARRARGVDPLGRGVDRADEDANDEGYDNGSPKEGTA